MKYNPLQLQCPTAGEHANYPGENHQDRAFRMSPGEILMVFPKVAH